MSCADVNVLCEYMIEKRLRGVDIFEVGGMTQETLTVFGFSTTLPPKCKAPRRSK